MAQNRGQNLGIDPKVVWCDEFNGIHFGVAIWKAIVLNSNNISSHRQIFPSKFPARNSDKFTGEILNRWCYFLEGYTIRRNSFIGDHLNHPIGFSGTLQAFLPDACKQHVIRNIDLSISKNIPQRSGFGVTDRFSRVARTLKTQGATGAQGPNDAETQGKNGSTIGQGHSLQRWIRPRYGQAKFVGSFSKIT